jgi:hypothetical protein
MWSKKPEFIDPEKKNLTYYYDRSKNKKRLEKNLEQDSRKRKRFMVFSSKRGKIIMIILYLGVVAYLFFSPRDPDPYSRISHKAEYRNTLMVLSGYYREADGVYLAQILFRNKDENRKEIAFSGVNAVLRNRNYESIAQKSFSPGRIVVPGKGIYNLRLSIDSSQKPAHIQAVLFFSERKITLQKNLLLK